jgi:N-carbamoyl-L-amino-acid hydrolase
MEVAMPDINGDRLLADLDRLREFGRYKTGVHRPTFSPQDIESRHWLATRFAEAGLDAEIDGIGNVIGRPRATGRKLLIGSHTETQNHAGWLDGALGVMYALETARAFREDTNCAHFPVEVTSWADEESHFAGFLGSRSFIGALDESEINAARDRTDGTPLHTALQRAGLVGKPRATIVPENYIGYLEAHIEQGDVLDQSRLRIGIVTSIVGIWQYCLIFEGVQNHAGTTRMAIRRDAGVALVDLCSAIKRRFVQISGPLSVWTTGSIRLYPGDQSIVPGRAEMRFQFRDAELQQLHSFEQALEELVAEANQIGPCRTCLKPMWKVDPIAMAQPFQEALTRAAERLSPGSFKSMPSAAGHDAQILARRIPAGMLFVPSIGGISHHWTEDTKRDDIVLGCQILAAGAEAIFRQQF